MKFHCVDYVMLVVLIAMAGIILWSSYYVDFSYTPADGHTHTSV